MKNNKQRKKNMLPEVFFLVILFAVNADDIRNGGTPEPAATGVEQVKDPEKRRYSSSRELAKIRLHPRFNGHISP